MNNSTTKVLTHKARSTELSETAYIYILSHISNKLVKVGETAVCPASREKGYTRKYELKGFSLERTFEVAPSERKNIEKRAHQILKGLKVSGIDGAREIFACELEKAVEAVEIAISRNVRDQKFKIEKIERRRVAEQKRALEMHKKKALMELQKRAEEAWDKSKVCKKWDQKIETFEKDFPLKKKVGLCFEVSRFKFEERTTIFLYFTFPFIMGAILALGNLDNSRLPFSVLILVIMIYTIVFLWTGGAFSRSNSEITDEKNTEKYKLLKEDLASAKHDFIRTWKSSNKNSVKPDAQANYPSWSNYPDMRQTMSKIA